jgi:putative flavoprotein involved in K+ transport
MSRLARLAPRSGAHDVIVVGAGHAGLATSYFLQQRGVGHVVLEKHQVADSWRSQRWDSFTLNSPNTLNGLPGAPYAGDQPDGFYSAGQLAQAFDSYVRQFELPVRTGVEVTSVEWVAGGFRVGTRTPAGVTMERHASAVVVASGMIRRARVPAVAAQLPLRVVQMHSADYRNPGALPEGAVLVVGSGQSGCQIAEELNAAGRRVYLCTSKVARVPRRYRGREIMSWLWDSGFLDVAKTDLPDRAICRAAQPQVSGAGRYGHTLSLQKLARDGVTLLGHLADIEDDTLALADDLNEHIRFADQKSAAFRDHVDAYIERAGIDAPPAEIDPADQPCTEELLAPSKLDLAAAGIASCIWCTGYRTDFSWLRLPVLDRDGNPSHVRGVAAVSGIYFVGFPWLHKRKSGIICGIEEDAAHVVRQIVHRRAFAPDIRLVGARAPIARMAQLSA